MHKIKLSHESKSQPNNLVTVIACHTEFYERLDCHPSRLIDALISAIPTIFMPDALPSTTLPIYPGLGQASNMLACIPGGLVVTK